MIEKKEEIVVNPAIDSRSRQMAEELLKKQKGGDSEGQRRRTNS